VAPPLFSVNDSVGLEQVRRLHALKARRNGSQVTAALGEIKRRAQGTDNLMPAILAAVEASTTLGEIAHTLRGVWGEYRE
jgi:methylmalonyl-CoA mutase N-terminal domain/subunit